MVKQNIMHARAGQRGFTLVELMIAMVVGGILMGAVMTSFMSQHNVYLVQDQVVEMQQNARLAMDILTREIRMAGYNPEDAPNAGLVTATISRFGFEADRDINPATLKEGDGDTNDADEKMTYGFSTANDANADGVADAISAPLGRNSGTSDGSGGSGFQPVADNLRVLEFRYLKDDGTQTSTLSEIRAVKVSMMVLVDQPDTKTPGFLANKPTGNDPTTGLNWDDPKWDRVPGYRSIYLTTTVQCRNLGL